MSKGAQFFFQAITAAVAVAGTASSISQAQKKPPGPSAAQKAAQQRQARSAVKRDAEARAGIAARRRLASGSSPLAALGSRKPTFGA